MFLNNTFFVDSSCDMKIVTGKGKGLIDIYIPCIAFYSLPFFL